VGTKMFKPFLFLGIVLAAVSQACYFGRGDGQATETLPQSPVEQSPLEKPTVEQPPKSSVPFELDSRRYTHPSGAFSFFPPAGWSQDESENGSILLTSPDQAATVYVTVTNTGYELTSQGFLNFAQNVEDNFFGNRDQYRSLGSQTDPASDLVFKKNFLFNDVLQEVISFHHQEGNAIYSVDFWAEASQAEQYMLAYENIKFDYNPSKVSNLPVYNFIYTFDGPKNLFEIEIPMPWKHEESTDTNLVVDSIHAPDDHALIESIVYDDGYPYAKADAGQAALRLLNQFYTNGAGDISVTEDSIMKDGRERLVWESKQGGFSGITTFEVRNETSLLIFSVLYDDPYADTYRPLLEYIIDTYDTPQ